MKKENLSGFVKKAKNGDNQALNVLFTETYNNVYYFALKTVKDETLAADITQETFVTVFQNINTLKDPAAYPAWSRQITYRHCLQHLKKQNREVVVEENEEGSTIFDTIQEDRVEFIPGEELDKEDFKKTILAMVDSLPEEQRTAVILYYYDELSVKEIAQIQGVSEGTVKSRLNYGRKAIKSSVEAYEKKNNIKLRCAGVLPLLLWLFTSDFGGSVMSTTTVQTIASGVSATTGTTLSISTLMKKGVKAVRSLWQKIAAGLVATAVAVGGTVAVVNMVNKSATPDLLVSTTSVWQGQGSVDTGLNSLKKYKFQLSLSYMNDKSVKGILLISDSNGASCSRNFEGVGRYDIYVGSAFYNIKLNKEPNDSGAIPYYEELTLRYDPVENTFQFCDGFYGVVLEFALIIETNKTE